MKTVLGYWSIHGLAAPIRMLMHYCNEDFEDKMYECDLGPPFTSDWLQVKPTLDVPFANLPYLIEEGGLKISQSDAIIKHIGRKHDLVGKSLEEQAHVDMLLCQAMDMSNGTSRICYNAQFNELRPAFVNETIPKWVNALSAYLGEKEYMIGSLTVADFVMFARLRVLAAMAPGCLDASTNVKKFMERMEALPAIAKYLGRPEVQALKFNNKMAAWGA